MGSEKVVAVGRLNSGDLDVIGSGLRRAFAAVESADFADLLLRLDKVEGVRAQTATPAVVE
jgi:hypothetical protein